MHIRKNIAANALTQLWVTFVSIIFVPVYIDYIGIESYGLIGMFAMLQTWLSLLDMGLSPVVTREMAKSTGEPTRTKSILDLLRSIEIILSGVAIFIIVLIWLVSNWLAKNWVNTNTLDNQTVSFAFVLMGGVIALRLIENTYRSALIGLQKQVKLGAITCTIATVRAVGAILVLAFVSSSIVTYFYWQIFASLISLFSLAILTYRSIYIKGITGQFALHALKSVWKFGAGLSLITLLGLLLSQVDKVILSKLLTLKEFGYYSLAYVVASVGRMVVQPVYEAVYPKLTLLIEQQNQVSLALTYHKSNQLCSVLLGSAGIFIAIFSESVLTIWTHNQELSKQVAPVLKLLVCGMVLNGMMNGPYYLQLAAGWTRLLVKVNLLLILFFVPVIYFLTLNYGIEGAAFAWLILNIIYLVTVASFMHKRLLPNEMRKWYIDDLCRPLFLPLIGALIINSYMPKDIPVVMQMILMIVSALFILFLSIISAPLVRSEIYHKCHSLMR